MTEDIYLSLAAELYEKNSWDKETFIKRVMLYAKEKNMDMALIDEFIKRVTKYVDYSIDEKKKFLAAVTLDGNELKYGDAVYAMTDDMIEKFYKLEELSIGKDKIDKFFEIENSKEEVAEETSEEKKVHKDEVKEENAPIEEKREEHRQIVKVIRKNASSIKPIKKDTVETVNIRKRVIPSISDIINGNYTKEDVIGQNIDEYKEVFNSLINRVNKDSFDRVFTSLKENVGFVYASNFKQAWEDKYLREEVVKPTVFVNIPDNNVSEPQIIDESVSTVNDNNETTDIPETEEEYVEQAENITSPEADSTVRTVEVSNERLEKLKKNKSKVINYFLKTAIVIASVMLLTPGTAIAGIAGYCYFADKIKKGEFNPEKTVGKAIKWSVEKIMNIGIPEEELERGRTR